MKNKVLQLACLCFITVIVFIACPSPNDNDSSGNGNNKTGGILVVNNGTPYNYFVTITFNENEVFSGTMIPNETVRKTSGNNVEYKIIFFRQYPYTNSKIGYLTGGETIYYNVGE